MGEALREVFWNVPVSLQAVFYSAAFAVIVIFFVGLWVKVSIWLKGEDEEESPLKGAGVFNFFILSFSKFFALECLLARRVYRRSPLRALMLAGIVWSFIILFVGTLLSSIDHYLFSFLRGNVYFVYSFILDIAGVVLMVGVIVALIRKYIIKPERMVVSLQDGIILSLLLLITVTGFLVEGARLAILQPLNMDWSPIGGLVASALGGIATTTSLKSAYLLMWASHASFSLIFIAYIPYSKFFHIFAAQITTYAASKRAEIRPI
jgi:nitrate reductase gamma subunit